MAAAAAEQCLPPAKSSWTVDASWAPPPQKLVTALTTKEMSGIMTNHDINKTAN